MNTSRAIVAVHERERVRVVLSSLSLLVQNAPELVHEWRFFAMATYCLDRYLRLSLEGPSENLAEDQMAADTLSNLSSIGSSGEMSPAWERGFWHNSAAMRIDALWERLARVALPQHHSSRTSGGRLYEDLLLQLIELPPWDQCPLKKVRQLVNGLKHDPMGVRPALREQPTELLVAVELLLRIARFCTEARRPPT